MDEEHTVDLVYLDFAKAFDWIKHRFLLAKLKSSGIDEAVLNWINIYLSNRSYQVKINGVLSGEAPYLNGILLGKVIGPLLFSALYEWSARRSRWFCFPFCKGRENGVPVIPPPSLPSFLRLGLGGKMGRTIQPHQMIMSNCWEPPSPFSVFLSGRRLPLNSPGHRRPRPGSPPRNDLRRVRPLQGGCEYSKAITFHGPKILQWTIKNSVHSAVTPRVCNGRHRPNVEYS